MINIAKREERNTEVLGHIVRMYVSSAAPVSSMAVAERLGRAVSSATVRNIMAELEEAGLIEQPHTSAGRVPTDRGYRKYVDFMREPARMRRGEAERLAKKYEQRIEGVRDLIERTNRLMSDELHEASVIMWPSPSNVYLKHLELVRLRAEKVLAILVTITDTVNNYVIEVDRDMEEARLDRIANFVNASCAGDMSEIAARLRGYVSGEAEGEVLLLAKSALDIVDRIMALDAEGELSCEGLDFFAGSRLFSSRREVARLMREELPERGIRVYIGEENTAKPLKECSFITSGYGVRGKTVGRIGVAGSTRMDYENIFRTVRYLSDLVSLKLEEF